MDTIEVQDWTRGEIKSLHAELLQTKEDDSVLYKDLKPTTACILVVTNWQRELILAALEMAGEL